MAAELHTCRVEVRGYFTLGPHISPSAVSTVQSGMQYIIPILMVIATIKMIVLGAFLWYVFKPDIREYREHHERQQGPAAAPSCMYCGSKYALLLDEGQTRWEGDHLVLVSSYECQHCHLPFWHVERVPAASLHG